MRIQNLFLLTCLLVQSGFGRDAARPNVLFILADDLGYGDLGCYGATKVKTPNIDRLAREGCRFTDAHSPCSVCTPSRYNLLTGRYAWRTWNGGGTVWANDPCLINEGRYTLASLFREHGYQTAMLGKWHLGFGKPGMKGWDDILGPDYNRELKPGPLEFGFDYFWGFPHVGQYPHFIIENHRVLGLDPKDPIRITPDPRPGYELDYLHRPRLGGAARLGQAGGEATRYQHEELCDMLTARAVKWLDEYEPDKPFFLYLAHRNIHGPLKPAKRFLRSSEIGIYGDFLNEFDRSIGQVLNALDRNDLTKNTLVLFSSDNGGIFQYRPIDHPDIKGHHINGPLRGQKTSVYEGGVRVPLLARWPGHIAPGRVDDSSLVALTDMLATFAEFFGKTLPRNTAVRVGDLLFCSGQIPLDPASGEMVTGDIQDQTRRVLENVKIILEHEGLTFANAVKATVFLTDMADFAKVNEVYAQYFTEPYAARAAVAVAALPKGANVEIEVMAHY